MNIEINGKEIKIDQHRGVRQGDTLSPKLFIAAVEDMFKKLKWRKTGIKINGQFISHLRYADDIVLLGESLEEILDMMKDLDEQSKSIGLKMNLKKTKIMSNVMDHNQIK